MNNMYIKCAAISFSVLLASCAGTAIKPNYIDEITTAVESRSEDDRARDKYRNPVNLSIF